MRHSVARRDTASSTGAVDPDVFIATELIERLRHSMAALVPHMAQAAMRLTQIEAWKQHGFANLRDFARERFDHSGRWVANLAHLGQALHQMPTLEAAITGADGHRPLGRTAAFEISRAATSATLPTWIQRARENNIRALQKLIQQEQSNADAISLDCHDSYARKTVRMTTPRFLPPAFYDLERVYGTGNPGNSSSDYVDALVAERSSGAGSSSIREDFHAGSGPHHGNTGRSLAASSVHVQGQAPGVLRMNDCSQTPVSSPRNTQSPVHDDPMASGRIAGCEHKEFLLALWAEQHVQAFLSKTFDGEDREGSKDGELAIRSALELERQITLRQDQLLLWIDNRNAWSLLGFIDACDFGRQCLDESATTIRNRLRIARAMEKSPALRTAVDSGRLSRERLVRIARLMYQNNLTDQDVRSWIEHAAAITIKRFDDELRKCTGLLGDKPLPLNDQEWSASLRLALGEARQGLLRGGLQAIASRPVADVFLQLNLTADTAVALRQCLNQTRLDLRAQCQRMQTMSPAEEARLFPSLRLAQQFHDAGSLIPDWICLLAVLEEFAEEHDNPRHMQRRSTDRVTSRDGWRCTAPGCTAREVEVHHIVYQSQGGGDEASNLTSLCPFHHRMGEHGGLAQVTGLAPLQLHWRLGRDGTAVEYRGERLLIPHQMQ